MNSAAYDSVSWSCRCYVVVTSHKTKVKVRCADGVLMGASESLAKTHDFSDLYGFVFDRDPSLILMVSERPVAELVVLPRIFSGSAFALRLSKLGHERCFFQMLFSERYLSAIAPKAGEPARLEINRDVVQAWETFHLHEIESECISEFARGVAEEWQRHNRSSLTIDALHDALAAPNSAVSKLFATQPYKNFDIEDLGHISQTVLSSNTMLEALAQLYPRDPWAQTALPRLAEWRSRRANEKTDSSSIELLSSASDCIDCDPGAQLSVPYALNALARSRIEPTKDICIVMTARNEGLHLLEWLAWHRCMGIRDFFVYSNDNNDGSDALLEALARCGVIKWIRNEGCKSRPQFKAYGHAFSVEPYTLDFRWAAVIDADEFIMLDFDKFDSFSKYLEWQDESSVDAIALNWMFFGPNGHQTWFDELTISRFTSRAPRANQHIKTISRPSRFIHSYCHHSVRFMNKPSRVVNDHRIPVENKRSKNPGISDVAFATNAWINHYYMRSVQEFIWKKARGYGDRLFDRGDLFGGAHALKGRLAKELKNSAVFLEEKGYVQDDRAARRKALVADEVRLLASDPQVKLAYERVVESSTRGVRSAMELFKSLGSEIIPDELKQQWLSAAGEA